jgi:hypothetical protein
MLGEHPDATPLCPSIRIRCDCGRCPALRPGELRHELHTDPDKSSATTAAPTTTEAPTTTVSPTTAGCEDVAALKSSLEALTKVRPAEDGVTALKTAIANVKTNLDKAEASASPVLQPDVEQVKTAFAALQTAASGLTADNFKQKAPSIASAMKQVATATKALSSTLTQSCPGS